MKIRFIYLLLIIAAIFTPKQGWAGGAAARQQQMQQMQEQQIYAQKLAIQQAQKKAYEEAVRKRMMEYLAAKKAVEQKRAYEEALYKKVYEKKMAEKIAYERAVKAAMQKKAAQAVVQRKMQQDAMYQKKVQEEAARLQQLALYKSQGDKIKMQQYQQKMQQELQRYKQQGALEAGPRPSPSDGGQGGKGSEEEEEIVDISQVWDALEESSEVWSLMLDRAPKVLTVKREIEKFAEQGVIIEKDPGYYSDRIDTILTHNPEMKQYPLKNILRILAVMDYDFNNGKNRDLMAMEVLGAKLYLENKKRPGLLDGIH